MWKLHLFQLSALATSFSFAKFIKKWAKLSNYHIFFSSLEKYNVQLNRQKIQIFAFFFRVSLCLTLDFLKIYGDENFTLWSWWGEHSWGTLTQVSKSELFPCVIWLQLRLRQNSKGNGSLVNCENCPEVTQKCQVFVSRHLDIMDCQLLVHSEGS